MLDGEVGGRMSFRDFISRIGPVDMTALHGLSKFFRLDNPVWYIRHPKRMQLSSQQQTGFVLGVRVSTLLVARNRSTSQA